MEALKNKYHGQTCQIIGKGPSIHHLTAQWIAPHGPVITLNEAIERVEALNIRNDTYSMQKDGGARRHGKAQLVLTPDCEHRGECGSRCGGMVRPKKAAMLLHEHESKYCFEDYPERYIFSWKALGLPGNEFSLLCAVQIAGQMGCSALRFICCDAHANGDGAPAYQTQVRIINPYLKKWQYKFVTPEA